MTEFGPSVLLGGGPVAVWTAVFLQQAGIPTVFRLRPSERGRTLGQHLSTEGVPVGVAPALQALQAWKPSLRSAVIWAGDSLPSDLGSGATLWVAVPHTEALETVEECLESDRQKAISRVVVLSSGLGLGVELQHLVRSRFGGTLPVATYSNFFGASKLLQGKVVLKALKRAIHLGGDEAALQACQPLNEQLSKVSVRVTSHRSALAAEIRNICLYAHTTFGLSPFILERVLGLAARPRYLYKLYPEGPLTRMRTRLYADVFFELSKIWSELGLEGFNLLAFLDRENYPVPTEILSPEEIETFPQQSLDRQGELLFFRYCGLLVDPFGQPDEQGRFPDFSAVPVEGYSLDSQGQLRLPRIPGEDLLNLFTALALGHSLQLQVPALQGLERAVVSVVHRTPDKLQQMLLGELLRLRSAGRKRAKCICATLTRTVENAL